MAQVAIGFQFAFESLLVQNSNDLYVFLGGFISGFSIISKIFNIVTIITGNPQVASHYDHLVAFYKVRFLGRVDCGEAFGLSWSAGFLGGTDVLGCGAALEEGWAQNEKTDY